MIGETDPKPKKCPVEVLPLVWRINPAQQTTEHRHERQHTECVNLNDYSLAPGDAVKTKQRAGNEPRNKTNRAFQAPIDIFELANTFQQHAAAA